MCKFKSGLILKDGGVILDVNTDHHSDLLANNNIKDDTIDASKKEFARFEFIPQGGLFAFNEYVKVKIIEWCLDNIKTSFQGDLDLEGTGITSLPDGLTVGGGN